MNQTGLGSALFKINTGIMVAMVMCLCAHGAGAERVRPKVPPGLPDQAETLAPSDIMIGGWLGARIRANATNRLTTIDTAPLLAGFKQKPGSHPWIGEHIGKWMHAATLAWAHTGDQRLRDKLDQSVSELLAAQEPDGYLGTYVPEKRFGLFPGSDWDVWSHKYNLIGLLTYYEYTGEERALHACRKMADLLVNTFGPGKKSIISAGTHVGMAATSVLEPMVRLYRFTADERYLEFCRYILKAYDEPNGPGILRALVTARQVNQTANGKAYEMLSNLVGVCELARATGDPQLITPVLNAWEDVVAKRLYITGSASQAEHFREDFELPNDTAARVAETCVTATWVQLNLELLRITGEARFANELEKTFYNHLTAAQHPRGDDWCYFTPLSGRKRYDSGITCCHSSGPRGLALAPYTAYLKRSTAEGDALVIGTFESSSVRVQLNGTQVRVQQESRFPLEGAATIRFTPASPVSFAVHLRAASWANGLKVEVNGTRITLSSSEGWLRMPAREWRAGDTLKLSYELKPEWIKGSHGNSGLAALSWGPFIMAYDPGVNPGLPGAAVVGFADKPEPRLGPVESGQPRLLAGLRSPRLPKARPAVFLPFAEAGVNGSNFRVWLPDSGAGRSDFASVLAEGEESRSRAGNVDGSINDNDPGTFVVTFDGRRAPEDWYAITLESPATISRVVYVAGDIFHDGGWFDASRGKPRIQVKKTRNGPWESVAEISDYPETTATISATLKDPAQRTFRIPLPAPIRVYGVRAIGTPACGDNPKQAFSSCAELQAY